MIQSGSLAFKTQRMEFESLMDIKKIFKALFGKTLRDNMKEISPDSEYIKVPYKFDFISAENN